MLFILSLVIDSSYFTPEEECEGEKHNGVIYVTAHCSLLNLQMESSMPKIPVSIGNGNRTAAETAFLKLWANIEQLLRRTMSRDQPAGT